MDILILIVVGGILAISITAIIKSKKSGNKCIGCPHGKSCSQSNCDTKRS